MIEVFKTNIQERNEALQVINVLFQHLPGSRINVDLHDEDNILRIEASIIRNDDVIELMKKMDFYCEPLED